MKIIMKIKILTKKMVIYFFAEINSKVKNLRRKKEKFFHAFFSDLKSNYLHIKFRLKR